MHRLDPLFVERVWGRTDLAPLFGPQSKRIGEVWFQAAPDHPLLLKFLFTSDKLSVQVHPDDAAAARLEGCRGKTEMWHVIAAEPGSQVALGLRRPCDASTLRRALESADGAEVLAWEEARPGDSFHIPAGAIHAIGAGLTICEIQQNSDITYRLYDYNRGRELHLDKGLAVADPCLTGQRQQLPLCNQYFRTERLHEEAVRELEFPADSFVIVLAGEGTLGDEALLAGDVFYFEQLQPTLLTAHAPLTLLGVMTK